VKAKAAGMATTERPPAAKRRKPGPRGVVLASASLFLVMIVFLAQRVAAGKDPVLGAAHRVAVTPLVVHRIVRKVIVETTIAAHSHAAAASYSTAPEITSQSSGAVVPAPVTRSS
jgi:hypothetical protein